MSNDTQQIVSKAWNFAHVLRDDGLSYMAYTEQFTFLLFLRVAEEMTNGEIVISHQRLSYAPNRYQDPTDERADKLIERIRQERETSKMQEGTAPHAAKPTARRRGLPKKGKERGKTMSATITVEEAQAKLKEIIHQLAPGEELVITENQEPVAKLVSEHPKPQLKQRPGPGLGKGMVTFIAPDFDAPLEDMKEYME